MDKISNHIVSGLKVISKIKVKFEIFKHMASYVNLVATTNILYIWWTQDMFQFRILGKRKKEISKRKGFFFQTNYSSMTKLVKWHDIAIRLTNIKYVGEGEGEGGNVFALVENV